jgi:hypothetical protein
LYLYKFSNSTIKKFLNYLYTKIHPKNLKRKKMGENNKRIEFERIWSNIDLIL